MRKIKNIANKKKKLNKDQNVKRYAIFFSEMTIKVGLAYYKWALSGFYLLINRPIDNYWVLFFSF